MGRVPGLRIDRTGAAIIGASLMVATGALSIDEAFQSINYETIILLFGMMLVVANLRLSGFFAAVSRGVISRTHRPLTLLCAIVFVSGVFSAFFVNDTICVVLTPLVIEIDTPAPQPGPLSSGCRYGGQYRQHGDYYGQPAEHAHRDIFQYPLPDVCGGPCARRLSRAGLDRVLALLRLPQRIFQVFRGDGGTGKVANPALMWRTVIAAGVMLMLFFAGWSTSKVAIVTGSLLLITKTVEPEKVYREIDWSLLVMLMGLLIVIAGIGKTSCPAISRRSRPISSSPG